MEARFGPWRLGRRVAVGEYADVTEASRGNLAVALKRLHGHAARAPEMLALFERECAISLSVTPHAGLVRGLEAGDVDGRPWLAMPLIGGIDLRRLVEAGSTPDPARTRRIVLAVCDALEHLHGAGWVHGDVTPANLLVEPGPDAGASGFGAAHALLCDFGVARPPGEAGPVRGTHAYMAPEQVRGEPWSPSTDVFALGIVLWELSAGARLFKRDARWLTMTAVVEDEPPPLVDDALDAVVRRALAKDPAARFASAAELRAAIAALPGSPEG